MGGKSNSLRNLAQTLLEKTPNTSEREAFLARVREQIRSGEYDVNADALAEALLDELRRSEMER